jgi:hypothetical protein
MGKCNSDRKPYRPHPKSLSQAWERDSEKTNVTEVLLPIAQNWERGLGGEGILWLLTREVWKIIHLQAGTIGPVWRPGAAATR